MPTTCQFTGYKPRKGDHGYEDKAPRYMDKIAPCGADAWVDDLCQHHGVIMLCTEDALSVRVVTKNHPHENIFAEKGRLGGQKGKRSRRAKR